VFLYVYIAEAHSADEWPIGPTMSFCTQPKSIVERSALACNYVAEYGCEVPMLVDTMDNQFLDLFAAWPVRFFVIQSGKLCLKAQPDLDTYSYDVTELRRWLSENTSL